MQNKGTKTLARSEREKGEEKLIELRGQEDEELTRQEEKYIKENSTTHSREEIRPSEMFTKSRKEIRKKSKKREETLICLKELSGGGSAATNGEEQ